MSNILIIGAGRSSGSMIQYLLSNASNNNWHVTIAEQDLSLAKAKTKGFENVSCIPFDINNEVMVYETIAKSDLVVSMLPARFHIIATTKCAELGKDFLTASYLVHP